jgi:hypothetical protein
MIRTDGKPTIAWKREVENDPDPHRPTLPLMPAQVRAMFAAMDEARTNCLARHLERVSRESTERVT